MHNCTVRGEGLLPRRQHMQESQQLCDQDNASNTWLCVKYTAAVNSLLTAVMAVLQQKPWSERCAQCNWR